MRLPYMGYDLRFIVGPFIGELPILNVLAHEERNLLMIRTPDAF